MKILVIFTGGTIGSAISQGRISPFAQCSKELIARYTESHADNVVFETKEPYRILSENLSAETLNLLTQTVCDSADSGYDGIIVIHGTDTLQYSAAALSYSLGNECIPVVLVSSNYPLNDERANGNANFEAAVEFIKNRCGKGVYVAYRNSDSVVYFHRGLSLIAHGEADDNLMSYKNKYYARLTDNGIAVCDTEKEKIAPLGALKLAEKSCILAVTACPADSFCYDISGCKAVIMRPYHSGTLNTASGQLADFCQKASENNVPVYVVNAVEGVTYESSAEYEKFGIIPLYNTTFAAAYIKLWADMN